MEAILFLLLMPYFALILFLCIRLYYPKKYPPEDSIDTDGRLAIVVACKNEEDNLPLLFSSIERQHSMPKEIIFVDDNSTDNTFAILLDFAKKLPNVIVLQSPGNGKKAALIEGVKHCTAKYVLFTDADCILPDEYCLNAKIFLTTHSVDMLLGGVKLHYLSSDSAKKSNNENLHSDEKATSTNSSDTSSAGDFSVKTDISDFALNPFKAFEILDLGSLQAVSAGSAMMGCPIMCNGANMIVRRDIYLEHISGIRTDIPSGDDMFMLHNIKAANGKIFYLFRPELIISTRGNDNPLSFFTQRKRWIGKLPAYTDKFTVVTATITAVTNIMLTALYIASIFNSGFLLMAAMAYIIKLIVDCIAIIPYLKTINKRNLLYYMPLMSIFYPFYVTFTGIVSVISFVIKNNKTTKIRMGK